MKACKGHHQAVRSDLLEIVRPRIAMVAVTAELAWQGQSERVPNGGDTPPDGSEPRMPLADVMEQGGPDGACSLDGRGSLEQVCHPPRNLDRMALIRRMLAPEKSGLLVI